MTFQQSKAIQRAALSSIFCGSLLLATFSGAAQDRAAAFTGSFAFAGGKAEKELVDRLIDRATSDLSFAARTATRFRLKRRLPAKSLTIRVGNGTLSIQMGDRPSFETKDDGTPKSFKDEEGTVLSVSNRLQDRQILQRVRGSARGRKFKSKTTLTLSPDGKTLKIETKTEIDGLKSLKYELTYRRK